MRDLILGGEASNRAAFRFEGLADLTAPELTSQAIPTGPLALSRPSEKLDAAHWPVRGDLAHIRLAGRCFVPHYAVPMPHTVIATGTTLRKTGNPDGEAMDELAGGTLFNVLDIAGGWAWGQVGEDGLVGYLPMDTLEQA